MSALSNIVKHRKIKQSELASELGISKAAVSMRLKYGIRNITTARRYARILNCDPRFLID